MVGKSLMPEKLPVIKEESFNPFEVSPNLTPQASADFGEVVISNRTRNKAEEKKSKEDNPYQTFGDYNSIAFRPPMEINDSKSFKIVH